MAKKKKVAKTAAAIEPELSLDEIDLAMATAEASLVALLEWIYSDESDPYYNSIRDDAEKLKAFNKTHEQANMLLGSLHNAKLEVFAAKARSQMPKLKGAVADLKDELEGQKRATALIGAFSKLLDVIVPILLP